MKQLVKKTQTIVAKKILKVRGRPRKDGRARGTYVVTRKLKKLMYPSPAAVARALKCEGTASVSRATVERDLKALNLKCYCRPVCPFLTDAQTEARLKFARALLRSKADFWEKLIFTDEKWFDSNDSGQRFQYHERRKQKGSLIPREYTQAAAKCFVWGAISFKWRILVFVQFEDGMKSKEYIEQCISELKKEQLDGMILMQDGAKAHWSADTREALKVPGLTLLERWPSGSPDLNPIERLWARLDQAVCRPRAVWQGGAAKVCARRVLEPSR